MSASFREYILLNTFGLRNLIVLVVFAIQKQPEKWIDDASVCLLPSLKSLSRM